jgi:hypothetical protein
MTDWNDLAFSIGFDSELEMFFILYEVKGMSLNKLSRFLGFSPSCISKRLRACGVTTRPKGGPNNDGEIGIKLSHLDPRLVHLSKPQHLATLLSAAEITIYKYLRRLK